ncbi:hypothetical protein JCM19992_24850 [Thermostilla marina]
MPEEYLDKAREDLPYLPIALDEFERLVRRSRAARLLARLPKAAIVYAEYSARLEGESLRGRNSFWEIACWGTRETFLALGNPTIALDAAYRHDDVTSPLTFGCLDDGTVGTLVDGSGRIDFTWTSRGRHDLDGTLRFDLQFPPCAAGSLILELPPDVKPIVDDGVVIERRKSGGPEAVSYQIGLPADGRLVLRILKTPLSTKSRTSIAVREQRLYDVSPRGVDAVLRFSVDVLDQPLDRCRLRVERDLQIVSVSVDGAEVSWSHATDEVTPASQNAVGRTDSEENTSVSSTESSAAEQGIGQDEWEVIDLQLTRPLVGTSRNIQVKAVTPWSREIRLPRVVVENAFWESGEAGVLVRRPLTTTDLEYQGARLLDAGVSPGEQPGEMFEFGLFDPDAELVWTTRLAEVALRFEETTSASLGEEEVVSETQLRVLATDGNAFSLMLSVQPGWRVEQVDGEDSETVRDWSFQAEGENDAGRLEIVLASPVGPSRPVTLRISARASIRVLQSGDGPESGYDRHAVVLPLKVLLPLKLAKKAPDRRVLQIACGPSLESQLDWTGADTGVTITSEAEVSADGEELSGTVSGTTGTGDSHSWIFDARRPSALPMLVFRRRAARFDVARTVRWLLQKQGAQLEYRFAVTAKDPIASLQIACDDWGRLGKVELAWHRSDDPIRTRFAPLTLTGTGSVRTVRLPRPTVDPFEIRLRSRASGAMEALPILEVLDAAVETLQVHVFAEHGVLPRIVCRGLERVDAAPVEEPGYRYVVSYRDTGKQGKTKPLLQVQGLMQDAAPKLWAWQERHRTRVTSSGTAYHRLAYLLHQDLPATPTWKLPKGVLLFDEFDEQTTRSAGRDARSDVRMFIDRVLVGGAPAVWRIAEQQGEPQLLVNLPDTIPEKSLVIEYRVFGKPVIPFAHVRRVAPKPSFDVLQSTWEVLLPPGYRGLSRDEYARWGSPPKRWLPRLFGPLVREEDHKPFLPEEVWTRVRDGNAAQAERAVPVSNRRLVFEQARRWAELIDSRLEGRLAAAETLENVGGTTGRELTWGALLTFPVSVPEPGRAAVPVLIDVDALASHGIDASTPVAIDDVKGRKSSLPAAPAAGEALLRVDRLFRRAGLVMIVLDDRTILTARERLPYVNGRVLRSDGPITEIDVNAETPLFRGSVDGVFPVELVRVDTWCRLPGTERYEPFDAVTDHAGSTPQGWTIVPVPMRDDPAEILVVDDAAWQAGRWIAFLFAFAFFWWLLGRHSRVLIAAALLTAAVGCIVPPIATVPLSGMLLGILAAWGAAWLQAVRAKTVKVDLQSPANLESVKSSIVLKSFLALLATAAMASGSVQAEQGGGLKDSAQRVIVPIGADGKPTGEVQVPETLYQLLHRAASPPIQQWNRVLVTRAEYRGALRRGLGPDVYQLDHVYARWVIYVPQDETDVVLAAGSTTSPLDPQQVLLDGAPLEVEWSEAEGELRFHIARAGTYRVDAVFSPVLQRGITATDCDIPIPRAPFAVLTLDVPSDSPVIEFPSSLGEAQFDEEALQWIVSLGNADRLRIRWRTTQAAAAEGPVIDVRQLMWLHLVPGNVRVDVRWNLRVIRGKVSEFVVLTDPRLALLESVQSGVRIETADVAAKNRVVRFVFEEEVTDRVDLAASFAWQDAQGFGQMTVPLILLPEGDLTRRWLAVSYSPEIRHVSSVTGDTRPLTVSSFAAEWRDATSVPDEVVDLTRSTAHWSVRLTPYTPPRQFRESLTAIVDPDAIEYRYLIRFSEPIDHMDSCRIVVPSNVTILDVQTEDEKTVRPLRWARSDTGKVTVFGGAPGAPIDTVEIRGLLHVDEQASVELPLIYAEDGESTGYRLTVARRSSARLQFLHIGDFASEDRLVISDADIPNDCRIVAAWDAKSPRVGPALRVEENRPRFEYTETAVIHADGRITVWFDLEVKDGIVDSILIDGIRAADIDQPDWKVEPESWEIEQGPEPDSIVLRPMFPVISQARFAVEVADGSGALSDLVNLIPAGGRLLAYRVAVETNADETTRRLASLNIAGRNLTSEELKRYRLDVAGILYELPPDSRQEVWQATVPSVTRGVDMEVACFLKGSSRFRAVARARLIPGDEGELLVELPHDVVLLGAWANGEAVTPVPAGNGLWAIPSVAPRHFLVVDLIYRGDLDGNKPGAAEDLSVRGRCAVPSFHLSDPIAATVYLVGDTGMSISASGRREIDVIEANLARLADAVAVLRKTGAERDYVDELRQHCRQVLDELERDRLLKASNLPEWTVASRIEELRKEVTKEDEASGGELLPFAGNPECSRRLAIAKRAARAADAVIVRTVGGEPVLCDVRQEVMLVASSQASVVAGILVLVMLATIVLFGRQLDSLARRFPHALGTMLGLAWWLWLEPSILGWGIVFFSVFTLIRSRWRSAESNDSVVPIIVRQEPAASTNH